MSLSRQTTTDIPRFATFLPSVDDESGLLRTSGLTGVGSRPHGLEASRPTTAQTTHEPGTLRPLRSSALQKEGKGMQSQKLPQVKSRLQGSAERPLCP